MQQSPEPRKNETAVQRARRALDLLRGWFEVLAPVSEERSLLESVCQVLVDLGDFPLAWVGLTETGTPGPIHPAAQAGPAASLMEHLSLAWTEDIETPDPTVEALRRGQAVFVPDIQADPACASWRDDAEVQDIASCLALPLIHHGRNYGVLAVYAADPAFLPVEYHDLLTVMAASLSQTLVSLRLKEELKKIEKQLALKAKMLDTSPYATFVQDSRGNLICVNQTACQIWGFTKEEFLKLNWLELEAPEYSQLWEARRQELFSRGEAVFESVQLGKDGTRIPVESHCRVITLKKKTFILCVVLDIREHKRVAEVLRVCEERYRTIFDNDQVGIFRSRIADGNILECNDRLAHMFGYVSRDDFLADYVAEDHYVDPDTHERLVDAIKDGQLQNFKARFYRRDGSILWLLYSARLCPDQEHLEGLVSDISELHQAKGSLQQSEEQHRTLVEQLLGRSMLYDLERQSLTREIRREQDLSAKILKNCEDGVVGFDPDFRITRWNLAMERLTGLTSQKVLGKNVFKVLPCLQDLQEKLPLLGSGRHKQIIDHERPQRLSHSGPEGFFSGRYAPLLNEAGELNGGLVLIHDLTSVKRVEKALGDHEAMVAGMMASGEEGVALLDRDLNLLKTNPQMAKWMALTQPGAGRKCHAVIYGKNQPCASCPALRTLATGEPAREVMPQPGAQGEVTQWVEIFAYPLRDPHTGETVGVIERFVDVTARRQAEMASQDLLHLLLESLPVVVGRLFPNGTATFLEDKIGILTGYSQEDFTTRRILWPEIMVEEDRESARKVFLRALAAERAYVREYRIKTKAARLIWLRESGHISCDPKGRALHSDIVLQDITEGKQAEELRPLIEAQLLHAQRMDAIGNLAGGIAHDFNNILGVMLGYTEMALMNLEAESPLERKLQQVLKAGKRGKDLVSRILSFSRPSAQERRGVRLGSLIKESLSMLRATLPATIELKLNLKEDRDTVLADPTQIHQVIINLCANAAHAMRDKGGLLEISLQPVKLDAEAAAQFHNLAPGPYLKLSVKDTGHGMERHILEKMFDPFFTTKKPGEGTGMGLTVVHGIIKAHEGAIRVQSEVDKGSEFQVYLPRVGKTPADRVSEGKIAENGKEDILFVDDEEWLVEMWQEILGALGFRVTATTSSQEALEIFRRDPQAFDLVITDQTMPHLTGLELAQEVLSLRPQLPIILCTGFSELVTPEKAKKAGIREYIMKPLSISELTGAISRALGQEPLAS